MKEGVKILVAYDGSDFSNRALNEAAEIAKYFKGSVTLLHIYWDDKVGKIEGTEVRDQPTMRVMADAEKKLKASKVKYEMKSERSDDVPWVILKTAKDEGYDYIAMGSRGMGGAKAWILGSVSSRVIAESHCPVIVVK